MQKGFFDLPLDQSIIKGQIVAEYFPVWAKIILKGSDHFGLIDLYCGPGKYDDGTDSTPLLVLRNILSDESLSHRFLSLFNDENTDNIIKLKKNIERLEKKKLSYDPKILNLEVTDSILDELNDFKRIPTLSFLDPWGYKGLSLNLIKFAIESWGSECLFFFNYNRINAALTNPMVEKNITVLFGEKRLEDLREKIRNMNADNREFEVMDAICASLRDLGGKHVLPFCFKHAEQDRTSHYLIFVGTHPLGYGIVKEIMAKYSNKDDSGVPSFVYDSKPKSQLEFTFNKPFLQLVDLLKKDFHGQTLSFRDIYKMHQSKTLFIKQNYKDALLHLEQKGDIMVDIPLNKRPMRNGVVTLGESRTISFK